MHPRTWKTLIGLGVLSAMLMTGVVTAPVVAASVRPTMSAAATSGSRPDNAVANPNDAMAQTATGIVPPQDPSASLAPDPDFTSDGDCQSGALDDSESCNTDVVKAIDKALAVLESMSSLTLKLSAYDAMSLPEQLFVITDLERTDRGLAPLAGLTTQLDNVAQTGAANGTDPDLSSTTLTGGATVTSWASIWAGGTSNPLGSDYYWMYDDGPGSPNGSCTPSSSAGCWGHRNAILGTFATCGQPQQYMGAGESSTGSSYGPSFAAIIVGACGPTPTDVVFTWAQAQQALEGGSGASVPAAPEDVTAAPGPKKGVVLGWQAPVDNGAAITGYKIFRSRSQGAERLYSTVACTSSSCTYANKQSRAKTMYFYTVAAVNSVGTGPASSEVSARSR
jgi:hypothetical protein